MKAMRLVWSVSLLALAACGDDDVPEFPTEPLGVERGFRSSTILPEDDDPATPPNKFIWASTPEVHSTIDALIAFVDGPAPANVMRDRVDFGETRALPEAASIACFSSDSLIEPQLWPRGGFAVCLEVPGEVTAQIDIQITETGTQIFGLPTGSSISSIRNSDPGNTNGSCLDFIDDDQCLVGPCQVPDCN